MLVKKYVGEKMYVGEKFRYIGEEKWLCWRLIYVRWWKNRDVGEKFLYVRELGDLGIRVRD